MYRLNIYEKSPFHKRIEGLISAGLFVSARWRILAAFYDFGQPEHNAAHGGGKAHIYHKNRRNCFLQHNCVPGILNHNDQYDSRNCPASKDNCPENFRGTSFHKSPPSSIQYGVQIIVDTVAYAVDQNVRGLGRQLAGADAGVLCGQILAEQRHGNAYGVQIFQQRADRLLNLGVRQVVSGAVGEAEGAGD